MSRAFFFAAVFSLILVPPALALPDSIYITVPNGTASYITVQLPDDSGWAGRGEVQYNITMEPEPLRTWSDFSEQIVRTDENNTVQIPVYFSRRSNASCGERFTLTIDAPAVGARRVITGGACESSIAGVSTAPAAAGQGVGSSLNQNFGLFDMAFAEQSFHAQPGGVANVTALVSSYQAGAALHVTLAAGNLGVAPAAHDVSFGAAGGQQQLLFQVQAPDSPGTYWLSLAGSVSGCSAQACAMARSASLVVGTSPPVRGGFSAQLFPTSINTGHGKPVAYRLTIYNNEATRSFNVSMIQTYGLDSDLREASLRVGGGSQQSVEFNVTPTGSLSSYEFGIYVSTGENTKLVTGYLNVNGMEAGGLRGLEMVQATGNQSAAAQAGRAYAGFQASPSPESYGRLQDELARLEEEARQSAASFFQNQSGGTATPATPAVQPQYYPPATTGRDGGIDLLGRDMWVLVAAVGILLAASIALHLRKGKGSGRGLKQEFVFGEGNAQVS